MDLGRLKRRLHVAGRGEEPAVVRRTAGDDASLHAARSQPRPVADHELPPLEVIEDRDDRGHAG